MANRKEPHQSQGEDSPSVFEQFGNSIKGDIHRLATFGVPNSSGESIIDPRTERWLDVLDSFEDSGNKSKLVAMLKSGHSLPDVILPLIGDMIDRWNLVRPKHRMRIPSHRVPANDIAMNMANCELEDLLNSGKPLSVADAAADIVAKHNERIRTQIDLGVLTEEDGRKRFLTNSMLEEWHAKRRSPDRRIKDRTYKRKPRIYKAKRAGK
jgi:hypothetical protein